MFYALTSELDVDLKVGSYLVHNFNTEVHVYDTQKQCTCQSVSYAWEAKVPLQIGLHVAEHAVEKHCMSYFKMQTAPDDY